MCSKKKEKFFFFIIKKNHILKEKIKFFSLENDFLGSSLGFGSSSSKSLEHIIDLRNLDSTLSGVLKTGLERGFVTSVAPPIETTVRVRG